MVQILTPRTAFFVLTRFSPSVHTFCLAGRAFVQGSGSAGDDLSQSAVMDTFSAVSTVSLPAPSRRRGQALYLHLFLSAKVLPESDHWHLAFLRAASGFSMVGLRGAEATAWFSRVKTKRLLKIPRSSHDPSEDLDPTCVRFPFCGLGRTKSTYLADLFPILLRISDNGSQCLPCPPLNHVAQRSGNDVNLPDSLV